MLVDTDAVILQALREHLDWSGYTVGTLRPADLTQGLPFVMVTRLGGAAGLPSWRVSPAHVDRATYGIQAWAGPHLAHARTVCRDCLHTLRMLRGTVVGSATIVGARIVSGPFRVADAEIPAEVHRMAGSVALTVHP